MSEVAADQTGADARVSPTSLSTAAQVATPTTAAEQGDPLQTGTNDAVVDGELQRAAGQVADSALDASIAATLAQYAETGQQDNSQAVASDNVSHDVPAALGAASDAVTSTGLDSSRTTEADASDPRMTEAAGVATHAPGPVEALGEDQPPGFLESNPGTPLRDVTESTGQVGPASASSKPSSLATTAKPKSSAPLSRVAQLTARIEKDPLDGEAQLALLQDAEQKGDLERTREVYEGFLKVFPDAAKQWIAYADLELSHGLFDRVQDIFIRCLRASTSVALWKFYLDFVRRRNPVDLSQPEQAKAARGTIAKSFEFALNHVGQDRRAGELWSEYLDFLKEGGNRGNWEDQQKMDALRKTYQRAVQIPVENVEQIWQEYNQFENNMSKMTAKKFVAEFSPAYMTARKTLRELRARFDDLPEPNLPQRPDWTRQDQRALELWRQYLAYEESNPLDLEDTAQLQARVGFAYKKAVAGMRFFSEIWYRAAQYNVKLGNEDEARIVLHTGLLANPASLLLGYTLADMEEGRAELDSSQKIYDTLIEHFHEELAKAQQATQEELREVDERFSAQVESNGHDEPDDESTQRTVQEREEVKRAISKRGEEIADKIKKAAASVWITQMRFARRALGVKQARLVFTKARKSPSLTWQVVDASAMMEYHWNGDAKVATNVFELGLKTFSKDPEYVLQYLNFLMLTNNPNNARALFERTVALVEPEKARKVWDRMVEYECQYGDYPASQKIIQRYSEAFPESSPIERFVARYGQQGLDEAMMEDLGFVRPKKARGVDLASTSPARAGKRGASVEPDYVRAGSVDRESAAGDFKRFKPNPDASPAPSSVGGNDGPGRGWNRGRDGDAENRGGLVRKKEERDLGPAGLNRPAPFKLDPAGRTVAVLPDAVVFFLSLLPPASSFTGPMLNPATLVDVIGTTLLPGSAPGGGLPGERLGIPPRPKPGKGGDGPGGGGSGVGGGTYDRSPRPFGGRGEPDYSYGARPGPGGGGGGGAGAPGGGRRPRY